MRPVDVPVDVLVASSLRFLLPRPDANCDVTRADGACSDVQGTELLGLDFLDSIIIGDADWTI
jgi:hypothetical protein